MTVQKKSVTRDPNYGAEVVTWVTHAERWAEVRDINAVERVADALRTLTRTTMVSLRWVDDLTSDMRLLLDDGRLLAITSIAELRRKEGQQLACEEYSA